MIPSTPPPSRRRPESGDRDPQRGAVWHGLDQSFVMTVELLAGIVLYGGLGYLADEWLGTGPWLVSLGTLVGLVAGLYLLWLRSERMDAEPHADTRPPRR